MCFNDRCLQTVSSAVLLAESLNDGSSTSNRKPWICGLWLCFVVWDFTSWSCFSSHTISRLCLNNKTIHQWRTCSVLMHRNQVSSCLYSVILLQDFFPFRDNKVEWKLDFLCFIIVTLWVFFNCCAAVFRAVKVGLCAVDVKPTDLPERITAVCVRGAYAAWTITVPGEKMSPSASASAPEFISCILHPLFSLVILNLNSFWTLTPFPILCFFRINNCVGELNQKYFIQFLFYTGEYIWSTGSYLKAGKSRKLLQQCWPESDGFEVGDDLNLEFMCLHVNVTRWRVFIITFQNLHKPLLKELYIKLIHH